MSASVREIKATILTKYQGNESFFGGDSALDQWVGYVVVLGFGAAFSVFTTLIVMVEKWFSGSATMTSEHFK